MAEKVQLLKAFGRGAGMCRPVAVAVALGAACACAKRPALDEQTVSGASEDVTFSPEVQVTAGTEANFAPDMTPDGEWVVYTSDRAGDKDVWKKRANGGFARQLTFHSADDFHPVTSPDGDSVAFVSRRADAGGDIHILELGFTVGGGETEGDIEQIVAPLTEDDNPAWFPDSRRVVFAARTPGSKISQLMTADLKDLKAVPLGDVRGDQPTVSPDGTRIAFVRDGALFVHTIDGERTSQLTSGGLVQDGEPRFTLDGTSLVFVRYADDTNGDGALNADDNGTIWRLELDKQLAEANKDNFRILPLTSATHAAHSPQIRGLTLYTALQTVDGLDIFKYPAAGQVKPAREIAELKAQVDSLPTEELKSYAIRLAQATAANAGNLTMLQESILLEMDRLVLNRRQIEVAVLSAKARRNLADNHEMMRLLDLAAIGIELAPLRYPGYSAPLTMAQVSRLGELETIVSAIIARSGGETSGVTPRVRGRATLLKAQVLAAKREFFEANKLLLTVESAAPDNAELAAEAALYAAEIAPATSDPATAARLARETVARFPTQRDIVRRASDFAVAQAAAGQEKQEALAALRAEAKGLPVLPALAHRRIADLYFEAQKTAVAANELRQIVDQYPDSPEVVLGAAAQLSLLEEQAGRHEAAETMLKKLHVSLGNAKPEEKRAARALYSDFLLRRGEAWLKAGEPALAIKEYKKITEVEPLSVGANRGIIDARRMTGEVEKTIKEYRVAADTDPPRAERLYFHGYALTYLIDAETSPRARLSRINDCIKVIEEARALDSSHLYIHQTLGWLYLQKGYWQREYEQSGAVLAKVMGSWRLFADFVGSQQPNWLELAIDSFQTGYFLAKPESVEQAGLARNLGQTYYELKNFRKSLAYYMVRIKQLSVIPIRNARAEGIILRRAARAAFQTDELELAESLQRKALAQWEGVGEDKEIAYSLDALALTLRERGRYKDAAALYERLRTIHERLGQRENLVGTLSNLGFCAFMDRRYEEALAFFADAERTLAETGAGQEGEKPAESEAIKVDLGGQASAAKGFNLFARLNLIMTFRARVYEQQGRVDMAMAELERKVQALREERTRLIKEEKKPDTVLVDEIAIVQNNLAAMKLAHGWHSGARAGFREASATAQMLRPDGQKYLSPGEAVNTINRARVEVRLAALGVLPAAEAAATVKELDAMTETMRPVYAEGAKALAKPMAEAQSLSRLFAAVTGDGPNSEGELHRLEDTFGLASRENLPLDGILLASSGHAGGAAGELGVATKGFLDKALKDPRLEWKVLLDRGEVAKAFEALDRHIYSGGVLTAPTDRLAARTLMERRLAEDLSGQDAAKALFTLRRYLLLRMTELLQRAAPVTAKNEDGTERITVHPALAKVLAMQDMERISAALAPGDAVLTVMRDAKDTWHFFRLSAEGVTYRAVPGGAGPDRVGKLLDSGILPAPAPRASGAPARLYLVPVAEAWEVAWEKAVVSGAPLGQQFALAFLPTIDLLPAYLANARLPRSAVGYLGPDDRRTRLAEGLKGLDLEAIEADEGGGLRRKLGQYNILHIETPTRVNDVEPGTSVQLASVEPTAPVRNDLLLRDWPALDLTQTVLVTFANVQRVNMDLVNTDEGHDGWIFQALMALGAGVPSMISVERAPEPAAQTGAKKEPEKAAPAPPAAAAVSAGKEFDWVAFYQAFAGADVAESAWRTKVPGRLIGYAGVPTSAEQELAKTRLEKVAEEAEEAFDSGEEYTEAVNGFREALYYADRLGMEEEREEYTEFLVKSLYSLRDYAGALHYQRKAAARLKPEASSGAPDKEAVLKYGNALVEAAVLGVRAQKYADAEALLGEAEALFTTLDDKAQLGKIWHYRGINAQNQKLYDQTITAYLKSRDFYAAANPEQAAFRVLDVGTVYKDSLSDYPKALDYYSEATEAFKKLGKADAYLPVQIDRANTLIAVGQIEEAITVLDRDVIPEIDLKEKRVLWVRATQALAGAYVRAGLYQNARDWNERTLKEIEGIENPIAKAERQAEALDLKGYIGALLGQFQEAFKTFRAGIKLAREYKLKSSLARLYNNYGYWAREYGAVDESITFFEMALRLDEELKSKASIAYDHRNMGISVTIKGDYNRAKDLLRRALATSEELNLAYNAAYCHFGLGDVAMREKKWPDAEAAFRKALKISQTGYMQDFVWRAHAGVAAALLAKGDTRAAAEEFGKALQLMEQLRAGLKLEESRNGFLSDAGSQEVYENYALTLLRMGQVEQAWQVAERARARAFIDSIGKQKLKFAREASVKLVEEERVARLALDNARRRRSQAAESPQAGALDAAVEQSRLAHEAVLNKVRQADSQLALLMKVDAAAPDELARLLGAGTALIQYLSTRDALIVWVIRDGRVQGVEIPVGRDDLASRVGDFRMLMQNYSSTAYLGRDLYNSLIKPVVAQIEGAGRLVVVPHGPLHFFPFAALPGDASTDEAFLIDRFRLSYLDAATAARFAATASPPGARPEGVKVSALANPDVGKDQDPLWFAGKEARVIGRYFPQTTVYTGGEATESRFVEDAGRTNILHVAAHGEFSPLAPWESHVSLARSKGDDGDVTVSEIFNVDMRASLVALSACDSGLGALTAGNEIIGLSRALSFAGADSVLTALWRISDVASAVTMKRFYRYLSEGKSRSEALRQAQITVRRYFRHPAYWAAFKLTGADI